MVSQPAVSAAIRRLRDVLGDPIFVRTNQGMVPTPRARALAGPLDQALSIIHKSIQEQTRFDPLHSTRKFKIFMLDIGEMNLLPSLICHLSEIGATIRLSTEQLSGESLAMALETGNGLLAVGGNWPHLTAERGFLHKRLFSDAFVCLLGKKYPDVGATLSMEEFLSASHLVVGTEQWTSNPIDVQLAQKAMSRNVKVRIPHYLGVPMILAQSDLIVCMPARPAEVFARSYGFRKVPLPFRVPAFEVAQYWHSRFDRDPGLRWMIHMIDTLLRRPVAEDKPYRSSNRKRNTRNPA